MSTNDRRNTAIDAGGSLDWRLNAGIVGHGNTLLFWNRKRKCWLSISESSRLAAPRARKHEQVVLEFQADAGPVGALDEKAR